MASSESPLAALGRFVSRVVAALAAAVFALAGLLLMVGAVFIGAAAAAGLYLWARLRGRPPAPMSFRWQHTQWQRARRATGQGPGRAPEAGGRSEVVDIDFVEVREASRETRPAADLPEAPRAAPGDAAAEPPPRR